MDAARAETRTDRPFADALADLLAARSRQEIVAYERTFEQVGSALYRWDVWAAAYLIGGGCSDDAFLDFRAGVIALGQTRYDQVLASPDSLKHRYWAECVGQSRHAWSRCGHAAVRCTKAGRRSGSSGS
ncbi:DUF4240 domain-containing protein [Streptomyces sp. NPDC046915]|uniref:DUF4240 domain-containing protein n=1 Tax=Streptomyces sp. NPDC046915 TaxID=3155257 RepID=UPI0033EC4E35